MFLMFLVLPNQFKTFKTFKTLKSLEPLKAQRLQNPRSETCNFGIKNIQKNKNIKNKNLFEGLMLLMFPNQLITLNTLKTKTVLGD